MPGQKRYKTVTARWAFYILLIALATALCFFASSFMHALMLGLFVAIVVQPIHGFVSRKILPPLSSKKKKKHRHSCLYFFPFGIMRLPLRFLRRKFAEKSGNPVAWCCDWLIDTKVETCRAAVEKRRLYATLLTVSILIVGIAIPVSLFFRSAVQQCYSALEICTEHISSGKISQDLLELYRKPALRKLYYSIENNKFGHFIFGKANDYLSSPDWKKAMDQFFDSLLEKEKKRMAETAELIDAAHEGEIRLDGLAEMPEDQLVAEEERRNETGTETQRQEVHETTELEGRADLAEKPPTHLLIFDKLEPYFGKLGKYLLVWLKNASLGLLSFTGAFAFHFLIFIVTVFFAIHRGRYLYNFFLRVSPFDYDDLKAIGTKVADTSMTILWGSISGVVVQGVIAMVGFKIVGLPAFFLGLLCMICAIVPFVGTALVWGPAALYLWFSGHPGHAGFIVLCGILIGNVDGIVRPWVMSHWHNSNLSFAILFFTLLGGLRTCGFIGLIYAPIVASVFITAIEIFSEKYKRQLIKETVNVRQ